MEIGRLCLMTKTKLFFTLPDFDELNRMNYLAHAYLSFNHPEILVGNMISDFVKGRQKFTYSKGIQKGITLHRLIDQFTDAHEVTHEAKQHFRSAVGLYAGAFVDIVYDHFLALDETIHAANDLAQFATATYDVLESFESALPPKFARMLPYMRAQNWLFNYHTITGIENSFGGLVRRAVYLNNSAGALNAFMEHYYELKQSYEAFFPEVKTFVQEQLLLLLNED
jgi:acyl carrier protein phosphodiesterase